MPRPGDVIVIDKLSVVHSVVGCVLAEFATVSTDMVDRLHDQNEGAPIPAEFTRAFSEERIRAAGLASGVVLRDARRVRMVAVENRAGNQ